jgi:hypothetical protein
MSGGVQINTESLRVAGTALNAVGDQLDQFLNQLESELLSFGEPWGSDEIGQLISAAYKEVVTFAFDCLREVLAEVRQSGYDLEAMAKRYEDAEQEFTNWFNQFLTQLGR